MDFSSTDPFTQLYNAIWDELESYSEFTDRVKLLNRIKWDSYDDPEKMTAQDSDMPMCTVIPTTCEPRLFRTGDQDSFEQRFDVILATQDLRLSQDMNPAKWALVKALAAAQDALQDLDFVTTVRLEGVEETVTDDEMTRGTKGWAFVMTIVVEIFIDHAWLVDPKITAFAGASQTATGTRFLTPRGDSRLEWYNGSTWTPWAGSYLAWNKTTITLAAALDGSATHIRVRNGLVNYSNEYEL